MPERRNSESGNAFFIVMISVVLFAALMFVFSRSARHGGDGLSSKRVEIAATELIGIAQRYERAIARLRLKGCSENQLSFDGNNGVLKKADGTAYDFSNAGSPGDFSCRLFDQNGGGIVPYLLPEDYVVDAALVPGTNLHPQSPYFTSTRIAGHGIDSGAEGSELTLWLGRVTRDVCVAINDRLGISNPGGEPPVDAWSCSGDLPFQGSFGACSDAVGDSVVALAGKDSFCVAYDVSGWTYIFMTVMVER